MSFLQNIVLFLLSLWMAMFSTGTPITPSIQGSSHHGFGAGGKAWTERYQEFSATSEHPLAVSFERIGGAGVNTHVYRGFTQQDILIDVMITVVKRCFDCGSVQLSVLNKVEMIEVEIASTTRVS